MIEKTSALTTKDVIARQTHFAMEAVSEILYTSVHGMTVHQVLMIGDDIRRTMRALTRLAKHSTVQATPEFFSSGREIPVDSRD